MIIDDKVDTIERIRFTNSPDVPVVVIREHLIRYVFAMDRVAGKNILDLGCGSGYGIYLLSYLANSVSGYDYNEEAINEARKFPYKCDSCLEIRNLEEDKPLNNHKHDKFDVIINFETIEHLANPEILLRRVKEVVNENGVIYISTPNDLKKTDKNKWHKIHFDFYTLFELIGKIFNDPPKVELWGQDQWGLTKDFTKPYVVARIEL